jgi:hypothetical protein
MVNSPVRPAQFSRQTSTIFNVTFVIGHPPGHSLR